MTTVKICPNCSSNLLGEKIYDYFLLKYKDEVKAAETAAMYGADKTKGHFGRVIGIYDTTADKTVAWQCPDCDHVWNRGESE